MRIWLNAVLFLMLWVNNSSLAQVKIGAYYFDGWTGTYKWHVTPKLTKSFTEREPKWGWITSKQKVMDEQIQLASSSGLSFFSFCWYMPKSGAFQSEPLNNALKLFKQSKQRGMSFCLLVANHQGYEITPENWQLATDEWIRQFRDARYVKSDGHPLIIFFRPLIETFGSHEAVKRALDDFRSSAQSKGLASPYIALCTSPDYQSVKSAEKGSYDVITGYNYFGEGFRKDSSNAIPIDTLISSQPRAWDKTLGFSQLPYIPVITLNWDPRPWSNNTNRYDAKPYYIGYSPNSVFKSVSIGRNWLLAHKPNLGNERIAILYAWNENGEGAYLTPSKNGTNMLDGVKRALKRPKKRKTKPAN